MRYFVRNESTAPELTAAVLAQQVADAQNAYDTVFAPAVGVLPVTIELVTAQTTLPIVGRIIHIVDVLDDPQALAYHTVDAHGNPVLELGVNACRSEGGNLLDVIAEAWTHEVFETARNPFVNRYLAGPWPTKKVADEACDPVQGSGWRCGTTLISNFTLPAWGDADDTVGPYDHVGVLNAPFACAPTGYLAFDDGSQTFGDRVTEARKVQAAKYSRTAVPLAVSVPPP